MREACVRSESSPRVEAGERLPSLDLAGTTVERKRRALLRLPAIARIDRECRRALQTQADAAIFVDLLFGLCPQSVQTGIIRCTPLSPRTAAARTSRAPGTSARLPGRLRASQRIEQIIRPGVRHHHRARHDQGERDEAPDAEYVVPVPVARFTGGANAQQEHWPHMLPGEPSWKPEKRTAQDQKEK